MPIALVALAIVPVNLLWVAKHHLFWGGSANSGVLLSVQSYLLKHQGDAGGTMPGYAEDWRGLLLYWMTYLSSGLFSADFFPLAMINSLFWIIYVLCIALLVRRFSSSWAALAAMILAGFAPHVFHQAHFFGFDLSVAALSLAALAALLQTKHFTSPGWCLVFGLAASLALLAKITAPLYLAPAILVHFLIGFFPAAGTPKIPLWRRLANLVLVVIGALPFAWLMGWRRWAYLLDRFVYHAQGQARHYGFFRDDAGLHSLTLFPLTLGPALLLLFALALILWSWRWAPKLDMTITVFTFVSFAVFFFYPEDMERLALAPLGGLAVLVAVILFDPLGRRPQAALFAGVAGLAFLSLAWVHSPYFPGGRQLGKITPLIHVIRNDREIVAGLREALAQRKRPRLIFCPPLAMNSFATDAMIFLLRQASPGAEIISLSRQTLERRSRAWIKNRTGTADVIVTHTSGADLALDLSRQKVLAAMSPLRPTTVPGAALKYHEIAPLYRELILPELGHFALARSLTMEQEIQQTSRRKRLFSEHLLVYTRRTWSPEMSRERYGQHRPWID